MTQGIFGNQSMGKLPKGIFADQAPDGSLGGVQAPRLSRGVFGNRAPDAGSGLGGTGGIFNGPTALGTALGLGEQSLPNWECESNCMKTVSTDYELEACRTKCDQAYPPETYLEPETPETPYDPGGQSYDASSGQACASANVISMVQAATGAAIDGKWGPNSQSKLQASGQSFKAFAPNCTGAVPSYSGGASSGPGTVTPGTITAGTPEGTPGTANGLAPASQAGMMGGIGEFFTAKFWGVPIYGWAAGLTIFAALGITFARLQAQKAGG